VCLVHRRDHAPDYRLIRLNHNLYWHRSGPNTYSWKGVVLDGLSAWREVTRTAGTPADRDSLERDPRFVNASGSFSKKRDFTPRWDSPLIDAGTAETRGLIATEDILGNPIYGTPDIGAIEYQPPYAMGADAVDVAANVRVYADGRFRNTAAPSGKTARLSVVPAGGYPRDDRSEWMNISVSRWEADGARRKSWSADVERAGSIRWRVGDLPPGIVLVVHATRPGGARRRLTETASSARGELQFTIDAARGSTLYEVVSR
jgi:hypothetical protein